MKMNTPSQASISPTAENPFLKTADLLLKKYRMAVLNRILVTIYVPIFVWLFLETFFK